MRLTISLGPSAGTTKKLPQKTQFICLRSTAMQTIYMMIRVQLSPDCLCMKKDL